jgi:hypothetical protein
VESDLCEREPVTIDKPMAKVQFGSGVAAISGRVAGTVFARNRGGAYMRRFSVPVNKRTTAQQAVRQRFAESSGQWMLLPAGMRAAWESWASTHPVRDRFGASLILTGHQAFCAVANNAALAGEPGAYDSPPPAPTFKQPVMEGMGSINASPVVVTSWTTGTTFLAGDIIVIWASPPVSPGVRFTFDKLKLVAVIQMPYGLAPHDPGPDFGAEYAAVFGGTENAVGKKIVFHSLSYSNGQLGTPIDVEALIID